MRWATSRKRNGEGDNCGSRQRSHPASVQNMYTYNQVLYDEENEPMQEECWDFIYFTVK